MISDILKNGRNAYSTMDNYYNSVNSDTNFKSSHEEFIASSNGILFNKNCNKSMEDNLE